MTAVPLINAVRMSSSEAGKVVIDDEPPADDILLQIQPGSGLAQNKEICTGFNQGRCIEPSELNERDTPAPSRTTFSIPESEMDVLIESYKMYPAHIYHKISGNKMGDAYQLPVCNGLNAPCQELNEVFEKTKAE